MYQEEEIKIVKTYLYTVLVVFIALLTLILYLNGADPKKVFPKIKVIQAQDSRSIKVTELKEESIVNIKIHKGKTVISAYTARKEECDGDPLTTASGEKVREGIIASNNYPFGTKIEIQGLGIFTVKDRMARKNNGKIDIFMWDLAKARKFGRKNLDYYVIN